MRNNGTHMNGAYTKKCERGAAVMIMVLLFAVVSYIAVAGVTRGMFEDRSVTRTLLDSRQSFYAAESGVEDAVYRHLESMSIGTSEVVAVGSSTATTSITSVLDEKWLIATAKIGTLTRKARSIIRVGNGASFNFGLQSDTGGITMNNSSSVTGNAYSNGVITGGGSSMIYGDVISAGATGRISGVHATGSAWAHTIQSSQIDKNAYYQSISGTTVGGISYPGSADQATSSLPIEDSLIEEWKAQAEAGGVITSPCPYTINSDTTIGTRKIVCDNVTITGNNTDVTLTGPLWIDGNLTLEKATFHVPSSLGTKSVQIVVDDPESRATSSKITVQNSTTFVDDDGGNSYVLLLSRNNSAKNSGAETAIDLTQSANGKVLVYAAEGKIVLANSVTMKEVTGYHIVLGNNTNVQYETGLASLLFSGGPGGAYVVTEWKETE
jgi:Tfp pilus assembly protein PilX